MSEGFELEPFHVPQQSRRDKLRERETAATSIQSGCAGLLPLYDPSLLSSAMLTCASTDMHHHHHNQTPPFIKEEGMNFMGFVGAGAAAGFLPSSASSSSQVLLDLTQSSVVVSANPNYNQEDINIGNASNPFFYSSQIPQNVRDFDPSFVENGGVAFKTHPLSYAPQDASSTGQGLSLSLSSHYRNRPDSASGAGVFEGKGVGNYVVRGIPACDSMPRSSIPIGPFTGYTAILKGSRFLRPAQQLLEEICDVGRGFYVDRSCGESSSSREMESLSESGLVDEGHIGESDQGERRRIKARLISILHEGGPWASLEAAQGHMIRSEIRPKYTEKYLCPAQAFPLRKVYKRYKQYCQQLQDVVTSFESVAGLSTAAPYTSLAIKAMSKHFRCLKNAITDQLRFTSRVLAEESSGKDENQSFGLVDHGFRQQKAAHNLSIHDQPHIWRPQRGLPERAVAVLRAWLFEHFLHPYPTDADKQMLAKQTGLSRNQVSNWFINARVRLWKPMVEEIHTLEMRQSQRVSEGSNNNSKEQCELRAVPVLPMDKQPENSTTQNNQDPPPKRYRNELANLPDNCAESMNFSYDNVAGHHHGGISLAHGNGGISLTLGLHQNNSSGLSEPLPVTVGHFGLMDNSNTYVMGDFESQNRHLGRDIGGQLLRDFVG